jgi:hypothetical protein
LPSPSVTGFLGIFKVEIWIIEVGICIENILIPPPKELDHNLNSLCGGEFDKAGKLKPRFPAHFCGIMPEHWPAIKPYKVCHMIMTTIPQIKYLRDLKR